MHDLTQVVPAQQCSQGCVANQSISCLCLESQRSPFSTFATGNKACYTVCNAKMPSGIGRNGLCMCDTSCASPKPSHLWWHKAAVLAADTASLASRSAWHNDQLADFVAHPADMNACIMARMYIMATVLGGLSGKQQVTLLWHDVCPTYQQITCGYGGRAAVM